MTATTIPPVLTLTGLQAATVDISSEAALHRDNLIYQARRITAVTTAEEARLAAETLKSVKAFTRTIEDTRKIVKEPVLALGRKVDDVAKDMTLTLEAEAGRISKALGAYQAEEQRKADEARRKAEEEERRIREETARKLQEAEMTSRTDAQLERKVEKIETKAFEQIAEVKAGVAVATPIAGTATRRDVCFEVTNIAELYQAAPHLVTLTPNATAIKAVLKANPHMQIPGLKHWTEAKAIVR